MRISLAIALAVTVSGCAGKAVQPGAVAPVLVNVPPAITPVELGELRGTEALIFPDIDVPTAVLAAEDYAARCFTGRGFRRVSEPHGFSLQDAPGEPFLRVMVASVSKSSALGLDGTGLTPDIKEAIADSVQGKFRCAT